MIDSETQQPIAAATPATSPRVSSIDILRGLTILWIIAYHLWGDRNHRFAGSEPLYTALRDRVREGDWHAAAGALLDLVLGSGYQGVIVFMMLSGISLTMNAYRRGEPSILPGYISRFRKLLVPYFAGVALIVATIAAIALVQLLIDGGTFKHQWDQVTVAGLPVKLRAPGTLQSISVFGDFVHEPHVYEPSQHALWFIPLLLQYYLIFPFAFRLMQRIGAVKFLVVGLAFALIARAAANEIAYSHYDIIQLTRWEARYALLRAPEFIIGMALGYALVHHRDEVQEWTGAAFDVAGILVLAVLLQLAGSVMPGRSQLFDTLSFPILCVGLALLIAPLLFKVPGRLERSLPSRALSFLGVIAFPALIVNECMRFVSSFLQYEGVPDAIWWFFIVAIYVPVGTMLAYPLARVLGLLPTQRKQTQIRAPMPPDDLALQPISAV